jgi:hypothetical protein
MNTIRPLRVAAGVIAIMCIGCSRSTPLAPSNPLQVQAPPPATTALRLVSGWNGAPVADKDITVDSQPFRTTGDGGVDGAFRVGTLIEVRVPDYLPRTTRASTETVTLWPIADPAEADAVQAMLYDWYGDLVPLRHAVSTLDIQFDPALTTEVPLASIEAIWRDAANQIAELTQNQIRFLPAGEVVQGHLQITVRACGAPICDRLPPYTMGEIGDRTNFEIALGSAGAARRVDVALRACVLAIIEFKNPNYPNPLPGGLLSAVNPRSTLTDFERRVIRLASLRKSGNLWPDRDPF